jgi:hypothetical protein
MADNCTFGVYEYILIYDKSSNSAAIIELHIILYLGSKILYLCTNYYVSCVFIYHVKVFDISGVFGMDTIFGEKGGWSFSF